MVASGVTKSMVSFGTGGVGKTYTLMQELSKLKLKEFDSEDAALYILEFINNKNKSYDKNCKNRKKIFKPSRF
jgi:replication-associated recombination protein RarA